MSGFRFSKRIKIAPGVRLNLNKRSTSLTIGGKGLHYTVGTKGTRASAGIPGTGLSYTRQQRWGGTARRAPSASAVQRQTAQTERANARMAKEYERGREQAHVAGKSEQAELMTHQLQSRVAELTDLLYSCLPQIAGPDLASLKDQISYPEFRVPASLETPRQMPSKKPFLSRPLGWPLTLIAPLRKGYEQKREAAEVAYGTALAEFEYHDTEAIHAIDALFEEYLTKKRAHDDAVKSQNEQIDQFEERYRRREPDAVEQYVRMALMSARYPEGIPNTCTLAYTATCREITLDYDLPPFNVVPEDDHVRYIKSRDELSAVHRSTVERRKIYLRLISSLAILTIHRVFIATTADVIDTVTFKGSASEIDPGTGNVSRTCLVSVATTRELFSTLNLAHVDPVDCLEHLGGRVSPSPASVA